MAEKDDQLVALLGIAASKERSTEVCPPDNVMSAFLEKRLDSAMHAAMLSHLNKCEDCYTSWEVLSEYMMNSQQNAQQMSAAESVSPDNKTVPRKSRVQHFLDTLRSGFSIKTAIPVMALASLALAMVLNLPFMSNYGNSKSTTVATLTTIDAAALEHSINVLPVPWQDNRLGFSAENYSAPAKAVGAGLWQTKNSLLSANNALPEQLKSDSITDWSTSAWNDYYMLGQWSLEAWVLSHANQVSNEQWQQLANSLQHLQQQFAKRQPLEAEGQLSQPILAKMDLLLKDLAQGKNPQSKQQLSREISIVLQRLFV